MAVTLGIVCIPLGGVGGGLIAAAMLPSFGWRSLFILGGAMPLAVAFLLLMALPESPRFLAMRPSRRDDLVKVMARMGFTVGERDEIADGSIQETGCGTTSALFASDYIRDTAMLWLAFFACLLTTYAVYSWAPTLLSQNGFDISMASLGVAIFNIGGVAGALFAASLTPRLGSRKVLLSAAIGGLVIAMVLALSMSRGGISLLFVLLAIEGAFINAVQTCLYALAAQMYPTHLRATGVGYAAGFGRTGAIVSSFVGAAILAGGWSFYFFTLATGMAITFLALSLIQCHIKAESNNDLQARQGR
jgi:AAHS family 4-hydroxybenzoate transporter-like MFS transporter